MDRVLIGGLQVAQPLFEFIATEALPGTGIVAQSFWEGLSTLVAEFGARDHALLAKRDAFQTAIDQWHQQHAERRRH